jgi:hypothetical protein
MVIFTFLPHTKLEKILERITPLPLTAPAIIAILASKSGSEGDF